MLELEPKDWIQLVVIAATGVAMLSRLQSESKRQAEQHSELKAVNAARFDSLGRKVDVLSQSITELLVQTGTHETKIADLDRRVTRSENHIDAIGREVGIGKKA